MNRARILTLVASHGLIAKSCLILCDHMDCSPPGSSVHDISQARILEWVAISTSRDLPSLGIDSMSQALAGGFFTTESPGKLNIVFVNKYQMCGNIY